MTKVFLSIEYRKITPSEISTFFTIKHNVIVGAVSKPDEWCKKWRSELAAPIWSYNDLEHLPEQNTRLSDQLGAALRHVLSDPRTFFLIERRFRDEIDRSTFNSAIDVDIIVSNALSALVSTNPDLIVFHTPPHHLHNYLLAKTAEFLNIKTVIVKSTPLPWRAWSCVGMDAQEVVKRCSIVANDLSESTKKYLALLDGQYSSAKPSYERALEIEARGRSLALRNELSRAISHLLRGKLDFFSYRLKAAKNKFSCHKSYVQLSRNFTLPDKYVVFFMHFQPERTSVPEGLYHSQQWTLIADVAAALPSGYTLVVKEHPAMFRRIFDSRARSNKFYEKISSLSNVQLAPLDFDSFSLVDKSSGVVTLTGTVGFEAIVRRKPVFVFGIAPYKDYVHAHSVRQCSDFMNAFDRSLGATPDTSDAILYCKWIEENSTSSGAESFLQDGTYDYSSGLASLNIEFQRIIDHDEPIETWGIHEYSFLGKQTTVAQH